MSLAHKITAARAVRTAYRIRSYKPNNLRDYLKGASDGLPPASRNQVVDSITSVTTFWPKLKGQFCLERSVAGFVYCTRVHGVRPLLVVGARIDPFQSHAWLESETGPEDPLPVRELFTVMLEV